MNKKLSAVSMLIGSNLLFLAISFAPQAQAAAGGRCESLFSSAPQQADPTGRSLVWRPRPFLNLSHPDGSLTEVQVRAGVLREKESGQLLTSVAIHFRTLHSYNIRTPVLLLEDGRLFVWRGDGLRHDLLIKAVHELGGSEIKAVGVIAVKEGRVISLSLASETHLIGPVHYMELRSWLKHQGVLESDGRTRIWETNGTTYKDNRPYQTSHRVHQARYNLYDKDIETTLVSERVEQH